MPDAGSGSDALLRGLAEGLADGVVRRYRVARDDATAMILDEWARRPALVAAVAASGLPEEIRRLRVYRDASAAAKKAIYHRLRRYRPAQSAAAAALAALTALPTGAPQADRAGALRAVAAEHVSTAERMGHLEQFHAVLTGMIGRPATVLDVGCGVLPVVLPLDGGAFPGRYWALDKDRAAVEVLRQHARVRADDRLHPLDWDIGDGWAAAHDAGLPPRCDVALLLKVVPVVARRSPALLAVLAATPAALLVVSGSRIAMAKHQDIERREARLLRRFFADHGLEEIDSARTPDEILYLVRPG